MDQQTGNKGRRKERIRSLLEETETPEPKAVPPLFALEDKGTSFREWGEGGGSSRFGGGTEPDPEALWKANRGGWDDGGDGIRPRFSAGMIRRFVASLLVFGGVWGIFAMDEPWALRAQNWISDALTYDMDFAAAQVWYETHFSGAPSFIPIFGGEEEPAQKVNAGHEPVAPLAGKLVRPFTAGQKAVEIMPLGEDGGSVMVKSMDTGRVLSVSRETDGGIKVVVRHTGNMTAEYGHLSGTKLAADDWVQSGDTLGWLQEQEGAKVPLLYFAVMKGDVYIDPTEVVAFD
ncbi:M23 family metallopeptidase [Paenibacillus sp. NFR01]|uniref:M23 family metallopeptidase n=1 Tax=Paenibacillus sp. NFR01 TaxID=1566279 RepID=UPI0008C2A367|nr:M23 family metallopeptidase [Paenibacillus sp. NFR01]SEU17643.1 stage IV sporulation protein FA [Paenibacillus sp. NFR01]